MKGNVKEMSKSGYSYQFSYSKLEWLIAMLLGKRFSHLEPPMPVEGYSFRGKHYVGRWNITGRLIEDL